MDPAASETSDAVLPGPSPPSRRGSRPRTIPEQVADHLGAAIIQGQYLAGERIREQELSQLYSVSRGPIREAIRALEKRGLVEFFPRRGAYAVGASLDLFADFFNMRAALIGMAARCLAVSAAPSASEDLFRRLAHLAAGCAEVDPKTFATDVGAFSAALYSHCGNAPLARILRDQVENSFWGMMWRAQALDFHTEERRRQAIEDWTAVATAIRARNRDKAERSTRTAMARSRNVASATLARQRGEAVDPKKLFRDGTVTA